MTKAELLERRLFEAFAPTTLEIINDSHRHAHRGDGESHFRLRVISEHFVGQSRLARHRAVLAALEGLATGPIHSIAIEAYSPEEWRKRDGQGGSSPPCASATKAPD